jgi:hypothetical protein
MMLRFALTRGNCVAGVRCTSPNRFEREPVFFECRYDGMLRERLLVPSDTRLVDFKILGGPHPFVERILSFLVRQRDLISTLEALVGAVFPGHLASGRLGHLMVAFVARQRL